jgi:hypothetical protein
MATTAIVVHSIIQGHTLFHNVQTTNAFRFKVMVRELLARGYQLVEEDRHENGWHSAMFWSLVDREYNVVPPRAHSAVLKSVGLPSNKVDVRLPAQYSTEAKAVRHSRSRRTRPMSPVRMG